MSVLVPGCLYYRPTWRDFFSCKWKIYNEQLKTDIAWRLKVLEDFLSRNLRWESDDETVNLIFDSPKLGLLRFGRTNKSDIRDKQLLITDLLSYHGMFNSTWFDAFTQLHDLKNIPVLLDFLTPFFGLQSGTTEERIRHTYNTNYSTYPYLHWPDFASEIPYLVKRDRTLRHNRPIYTAE